MTSPPPPRRVCDQHDELTPCHGSRASGTETKRATRPKVKSQSRASWAPRLLAFDFFDFWSSFMILSTHIRMRRRPKSSLTPPEMLGVRESKCVCTSKGRKTFDFWSSFMILPTHFSGQQGTPPQKQETKGKKKRAEAAKPSGQ